MNEIRTLNGKFDARCRRCLKAGPIQRNSRRNGNPSAGLGQHNNQRRARLVYATPVGFVIFDSLLGTEALLPDELTKLKPPALPGDIYSAICFSRRNTRSESSWTLGVRRGARAISGAPK
jgi:hypothetical protein